MLRADREDGATALNIFIGVLTNENTGRESEAPAELFRPQVLVDAKWPPNKAPQERRSPVMMDRTMKRCLELWDGAPAELFSAARLAPCAGERTKVVVRHSDWAASAVRGFRFSEPPALVSRGFRSRRLNLLGNCQLPNDSRPANKHWTNHSRQRPQLRDPWLTPAAHKPQSQIARIFPNV